MRARLTAATVVIVGLALALGATALVLVLRATLTGEVRAAARTRATEIARVLEAGSTPVLGVAVWDEEVIQILDGLRVVASSENVTGEPALAPGEVVTSVDDDPFLAVAVTAHTPDGERQVLVARDPVDALESVGIVVRLLLVGLPLLLAVVAAVAWAMIGRALAPVEAIRSRATEISAARLHRRVPVPPGRDEIARLAATMNAMLDRLEAAQLAQRRFVSDASHELRSPVAAIRQHLEVALAHPETTTVADLAGTVLAEDLRVQRLVDDLLLLALADERILARPTRIDLDDLAFEEARRIHADVRAVEPVQLRADEDALRRMIANLAENAARYAAGKVVLTLKERDGTAILTVDDDGPGIPEADRERIFERFVRLDRSRTGGGTGLGLAIAAEIARAHGGSIRVTDAPLGGARLEVRLPVQGPVS